MGSLFLLWTLVLLILGKSLSQFDVNIDCGSGARYLEAGRYWQVDEGYTKTGENKAVQLHSSPSSTQLNTLRVFTKNKRNCYTLPAKASSYTLGTVVYLIRASFYYGNYDGQSDPTTFDLEIEGMKWATVMTSNTEPQFHEVLYYAQKDNISVCLFQTKHKQFPFINALELGLLSFIDYNFVDEQNPTWLTSYRYSYGANADHWILGLPDDLENRMWEPNTPAELKVVSIPSFTICVELPLSVLGQAIEAPNPTDSINLPFTFNGSNDLHHYVRAYFSSKVNVSEIRKFDFYVNDDFKSHITIDDYQCISAQADAHSNGTLNVQLRPHGNSTSPPFISGIEIYTASLGISADKKKKNLGLLIGLPVGLALGLILPGLIFLFILSRRPRQGQPTIPGQERQANPQQSARASAPPMPSQSGEIPVSSNGGGHQTWVNHDVDMKELEELLELHITSMRI